MIEKKIQMLLDKKDEVMSNFITLVDNNIKVKGKADYTAIMYAEMLFGLLSLNIFGSNTRLELYKRLIHLLTVNNIMPRLVVPPPITNISVLFYGVGQPGLTPTEIVNLTSKNILDINEETLSFSPNLEVMYYAFPSSLGSLTSIKDENNFETISSWLVRLENLSVNGSTIEYRVYESPNITQLTGYTLTFKQ